MDTNRKPIADVMSHTVCEVTADYTVGQALDLMHAKTVSSVLVVEDELILGIVTERDVVRALHRSGSVRNLTCTDLMQSPVVTVAATTSCLEVYHLMAGRGFRHIAVTDEGGRLIGIASEGDILRDFDIEYFMRFKDVESVMSTTVCTLPKMATVAEAVALMDDQRQSCVVVVDNLARPVGILTERDVVRLCREQDNPDRMLLGQGMRSPVRTAVGSDLLHEAVRSMEAAGFRRLVVLDEKGRVCGLLTHHEIVRGLEGHYVAYLKEMVMRQERELAAARPVLSERLLLDNILRTATDTAVLAADRSHRIAYCSPTLESVLGLSAAATMGQDLREVLTGLGCDAGAAALDESRLADGEPHTVSWSWQDGGRMRATEFRISLVLDEDGQSEGYLLLAQELPDGHGAD